MDRLLEQGDTVSAGNENDMGAARREFLMRMYDQMYGDINRNVLVVWQSIGVFVGAIAVFALVGRALLPMDFATTIVIFISAWAIAHTYEATYWYNRNIAIIGNIERQFLTQKDLVDIEYYFGEHRKINKMLDQFRIQYGLSVGIALVFLIYHFDSRVIPGFHSPITDSQVPAEPTLPDGGGFCLFVTVLKETLRQEIQRILGELPGNSG